MFLEGAPLRPVFAEEQVMRFLDPNDLLRELESSFGALARGEVQCPPRPEVSVPGHGFSLTMVAWQPGMQICVKVVNVFDGNLKLGLPNHLAIVNLFDPHTGAVTCVMDATYITGIRTAAAAVLSHKLLSRPESRVATVVGAGVQAREHLRLLPLVRDLDDIQICSLEFEHAERLARLHPKARAVRELEQAIRRSDIVCLATHSPTPAIDADWVRLVVEDDGPGVADGTFDALFERFHRRPAADGRPRPGTGLGLAVVRGLVEAMGGRVRARASELGGLAVEIDLPHARLPAELATAR